MKVFNGGINMLRKDLPWRLLASAGKINGVKVMNKHFSNPDIDTASVPEDIWDVGGTLSYDSDGDAKITHVSSSDALDIGRVVLVDGLDINCVYVRQPVVLNGQTVVALDTPLCFCHRMRHISPVELLLGVAYIHTNIGVVTGVPVDPVNIRGAISRLNGVSANKTRMSQFKVEAGYTGFLTRAFVGLSKSQSAAIETTWESLLVNVGDNWAVQDDLSFTSDGTSIAEVHNEYPDAIPEKTILRVRVRGTTANNVGISGGYTVVMLSDAYLAEQGSII